MEASSSPGLGDGGGAAAQAAQAAHTAHTAQQRTAAAIQSIMFGGAFDGAAWRQVESFATEKAREMRSEKLKRSSTEVEREVVANTTKPRKIVKVKRR